MVTVWSSRATMRVFANRDPEHVAGEIVEHGLLALAPGGTVDDPGLGPSRSGQDRGAPLGAGGRGRDQTLDLGRTDRIAGAIDGGGQFFRHLREQPDHAGEGLERVPERVIPQPGAVDAGLQLGLRRRHLRRERVHWLLSRQGIHDATGPSSRSIASSQRRTMLRLKPPIGANFAFGGTWPSRAWPNVRRLPSISAATSGSRRAIHSAMAPRSSARRKTLCRSTRPNASSRVRVESARPSLSTTNVASGWKPARSSASSDARSSTRGPTM